MRDTLLGFRDAGVKVDAVWLDYEVDPLNLNYLAVRDDPAARRHIPNNVLASPAAFARWRRQLWAALMSAYVAGPVREIFPGASVSNWMTVLSTSKRPVPGMIGGYLAGELGAGFLGGIVAGFLAGYVARFISRKLPLPESVESLKPILIIPLVASLVTGLGMIYVLGEPMAAINT